MFFDGDDAGTSEGRFFQTVGTGEIPNTLHEVSCLPVFPGDANRQSGSRDSSG